MPSAFTHAFTGVMAGKITSDRRRPFKEWACLAVLPVLPDLDTLPYFLGTHADAFWKHRGFTHSFFFALLVALAAKYLFFPEMEWGVRRTWGWIGTLFAAVGSHGVLDALTDGGSGVALFSPFSGARFFFPVRPIHVSPISLQRFFGGRALEVLANEFLWIWLPLLMAWMLLRVVRAFSEKDE